jgi:hypothetical protein
MELTVWCIAVVLGSVWAVGVPVAWLFNGRRSLAGADYVMAPFLGVAVVVLVLQNLVYLNLPIRCTAPVLWLAVLGGWVWLCCRGGLRGWRQHFPWALALAMLVVYLAQGRGLLEVGVRDYMARAWGDNCAYTIKGQVLVDEPFRQATWQTMGNRPYLSMFLALQWDRLGAEVLHAFFTFSSFRDAKTLFEPTILLGPALSVAALFSLARRFGLGTASSVLAGAAAGMLPALALVHLEGFLSQTLSIPLLLLFPAVLDDLNQDCSWRSLIKAALLFAAAVSIYTELLLIFVGLAAVSVFVAAFGCPHRRRLFAFHALLLLAPFILNPFFAPMIWAICYRLDAAVLTDLYPWALTVEGVERLWLGDWVKDWTSELQQSVIRLYALGFTIAAFVGLARACLACLRQVRAGDATAYRSPLPVLQTAVLRQPALRSRSGAAGVSAERRPDVAQAPGWWARPAAGCCRSCPGLHRYSGNDTSHPQLRARLPILRPFPRHS